MTERTDDEEVYRQDAKETLRVDGLEAQGMFHCYSCGRIFHESDLNIGLCIICEENK